MNSNRILNSKIFKFFDYVFRLVLINMLIIIPSFLLVYLPGLLLEKILPDKLNFVIYVPLIFYLFQGITAGCDTIRQFEMNETKNVFKPFFKSLKTNYFKGLIDSIIICIIVLTLINSLSYFYQNVSNGTIYLIGFILTISFSLMALIIIFHLPLCMIYFEGCKFYEDFRLAFLMSFQNILPTIIVIIISGLIGYLGFGVTELIVITILTSLPMYLLIKLTFKKYFLVYVRTHKEEVE